MKHFRFAWMLLMFGGGFWDACLHGSDKDNGMDRRSRTTGRPTGTQIPDDPNPPMTGYIAHTMTEGELMYYGHDSEYSKEGGAVIPLPERLEQLCPRM